MKLSRQTHTQLQTFFREYFEDENLKLPKIEIYVKRVAGLVTKVLGVDGITIGRHILIRPKIAKYNSNNDLTLSKNLLAHEITHVLQYQKLGFFRFLYDYVKQYFVGLNRKKKWNSKARMEAYFEISHEIEARKAAERFVEWHLEK